MARSAGFTGIISAGDMRFPAGGVLTEDLIGTFVKHVEPGTDGVLRFTLQDANGAEQVVEGVSGLAGMVELFGGPYETAAVTLAAPGWRQYDQLVFVFTDTSGGTHVEAELFTHLLIEVERSLEADDHLAEALGSTGAMTVMPVPGTDDLNVQVFRLNPAVGDTMRVYGWRAGGAPGAPGAPGSGGGAETHFGDAAPDNALGADGDVHVERNARPGYGAIRKKESGVWGVQVVGLYVESPRPQILVKLNRGGYGRRQYGPWQYTQADLDPHRDAYLAAGVPGDQITPEGIFNFYLHLNFTVYDGLDFSVDVPADEDYPDEARQAITMLKPATDGPWSYVYDSRSPWAAGIPNVLGSELWNPAFPLGEVSTLTINGETYGDTVTLANGIAYYPLNTGRTSPVINGVALYINSDRDAAWPGVHHIRAR